MRHVLKAKLIYVKTKNEKEKTKKKNCKEKSSK